MSTARLKWLVLDRLVPVDDEPYARAELISRDPELLALFEAGTITEDQAIATLRARELRHRDPDDAVIWIQQPLAVALAVLFLLVVAVTILF